MLSKVELFVPTVLWFSILFPSQPDAVQIIAQRAAERWRRESTECMTQVCSYFFATVNPTYPTPTQLTEVRVKNRELQGHVDKIRQVVTLNAAPAAVWRLQTNVVPDFYIHNNLPPTPAAHPTLPRMHTMSAGVGATSQGWDD